MFHHVCNSIEAQIFHIVSCLSHSVRKRSPSAMEILCHVVSDKKEGFQNFWATHWHPTATMTLMTCFKHHLPGKAWELLTQCEALSDARDKGQASTVHFTRQVSPSLYRSAVHSRHSQHSLVRRKELLPPAPAPNTFNNIAARNPC